MALTKHQNARVCLRVCLNLSGIAHAADLSDRILSPTVIYQDQPPPKEPGTKVSSHVFDFQAMKSEKKPDEARAAGGCFDSPGCHGCYLAGFRDEEVSMG